MENTTMAIPPSAATSRRTPRAQDGFGLIELLMATVVIAFVLVGFAMIFGTASRESVKSANKTDAQQLATARMEKVRLLDYAQIGTVSGNPPGIIPAVEFVGDYTVVTKVSYVDDPAAGGYNTYRDYKRVKITVIVTQSGKTIAVEETKIAPPTGPLTDKGVLKLTVLEAGPNSTLAGVTVQLSGVSGGTRTDETDQNGQVVFADLPPNPSPAAQYVITASKTGYIVDPADVAPMPNALVRIAATSVVERVIHLSKPLGVRVTLRNASGGTLFTAPTPVQIATQDGLTWGQQTVSGGTYLGTTFGSLPVIAGKSYLFSANVKIGTTFYFGKSVSYTAPVNGTNASAQCAADRHDAVLCGLDRRNGDDHRRAERTSRDRCDRAHAGWPCAGVHGRANTHDRHRRLQRPHRHRLHGAGHRPEERQLGRHDPLHLGQRADDRSGRPLTCHDAPAKTRAPATR